MYSKQRYQNVLFTEDYPYLEHLIILYKKLQFATGKGTWPALFNTKGHKRRKAAMPELRGFINERIYRILGPCNFMVEPRHGTERGHFVVYYEEVKK